MFTQVKNNRSTKTIFTVYTKGMLTVIQRSLGHAYIQFFLEAIFTFLRDDTEKDFIQKNKHLSPGTQHRLNKDYIDFYTIVKIIKSCSSHKFKQILTSFLPYFQGILGPKVLPQVSIVLKFFKLWKRVKNFLMLVFSSFVVFLVLLFSIPLPLVHLMMLFQG